MHWTNFLLSQILAHYFLISENNLCARSLNDWAARPLSCFTTTAQPVQVMVIGNKRKYRWRPPCRPMNFAARDAANHSSRTGRLRSMASESKKKVNARHAKAPESPKLYL